MVDYYHEICVLPYPRFLNETVNWGYFAEFGEFGEIPLRGQPEHFKMPLREYFDI